MKLTLTLEQVLELEKCKRYVQENPDQAADVAISVFRSLLLSESAYQELEQMHIQLREGYETRTI